MNDTIPKLHLLYIEDEDEFRRDLVTSLQIKFDLAAIDVSEFTQTQNGGEIGEQFLTWLNNAISNDKSIDGVILDSDLSGFSNGISKEMLLSTFRSIGVPVCRYSKRQKQTPSERLKHFATLASEGAASILVPSNLLNGPTDDPDTRIKQLTQWLYSAFSGFATLRDSYLKWTSSGTHEHNAAELLSRLLGRPEMELDFVGYSGASLFFFGDGMATDDATPTKERIAQHVATKLGYWLFNYIIAFPGPILSVPAACAFVGITDTSLLPEEFLRVFGDALYQGPFSGCAPLFFREGLEQILMSAGKTGLEILVDHGVSNAKPIYESDPFQAGAYCIATDTSIKREDCAGPFDWIPAGAGELCRIEKKTYARFMPWLNV
jgi:hypothetical protein